MAEMTSAAENQNFEDLPFLTIIMPIRNEAAFIVDTLDGLLACDYPAEKLEVLVVDGMSDDGTREKVLCYAEQHSNIRLIDNPCRIVPHALNIGIEAATGGVVIPMSGHSKVPPDFLQMNAKVLRDHPEAWCVGGAVKNVPQNHVGQVISAALMSRFGVGGPSWRMAGVEGYVETLAFGAYHKWVFQKIGMFDTELVRNQDDELNFRILKAGGKIYMHPAIQSWYYPRQSIRNLWRQYYQYGYWRFRTIQKHGQALAMRQLVPGAMVAGIILTALGGLLWRPIWMVCLLALLLYIVANLAASAITASANRWSWVLLLPVIFAVLHWGYGLGFIRGAIDFGLLRRYKGDKRVVDMQISR